MQELSGGEKILSALENAGYKAYFVGGCVRDKLMGRQLHDIDIASSSTPEQTCEVFSSEKVIPTGIKHGTVTVISGGIPYEITTFRFDGSYSDSRRPDNVRFSDSIEEDLARRDLTINAVAMDVRGNITDPFGGADDIRNRLIRCVGDPEKRFTEDALRILRTARFASQLGFSIAPETAAAMEKLRGRLDIISRERVRDELDKLLCGEFCLEVLLRYKSLIAQIIPEIVPCFSFEQHSRYHRWDVWGHIARTVAAAPADCLLLRRAMLFHDIGKPPMFTMDENGEGHFKGHAPLSAEMAEAIMKRLHYDNDTIRLTCELIRLHSDKINTEKQLRRLIARLGTENFCLLMEFKKADNCGKNEFVAAENADFDKFAAEARRLAAEGECLSRAQLAVDGNDMLALGFKGKQIGAALDRILELVIDGKLPNDRALLTEFAGRLEL